MHARREAQWKSSAFLANSPRPSVVEAAPFAQCPSPAPAPPQEHVWPLWAARHSLNGKTRPLPAQPLPRVFEPGASKVADSTAFRPPRRRSVKVYSPAPVTLAASRRRQPLGSYEVPTAKRRDALVMETRQRLRYAEPGSAGRTDRLARTAG